MKCSEYGGGVHGVRLASHHIIMHGAKYACYLNSTFHAFESLSKSWGGGLQLSWGGGGMQWPCMQWLCTSQFGDSSEPPFQFHGLLWTRKRILMSMLHTDVYAPHGRAPTIPLDMAIITVEMQTAKMERIQWVFFLAPSLHLWTLHLFVWTYKAYVPTYLGICTNLLEWLVHTKLMVVSITEVVIVLCNANQHAIVSWFQINKVSRYQGCGLIHFNCWAFRTCRKCPV